MSAAIGRALAALLLVVPTAGVALVAQAGPAGAHSALERSDPADGESVDVLPKKITLTFNQSVLALGSRVKVTGPDGEVTAGKVEITDQRVTQQLEAGSPAGKYTVLWRVTSADGHPISGRFTFTADAGSPGAEPTAAETTGRAAPTGQPTAAPPAEPTPATGAEVPEDSNSTVVWLLAALGGLVLVAGLVLVLRRPGGSGGD